VRRLDLDIPDPWVVANPGQAPGLFPALADLLPAGAVLYFEGTSFAREVRAFLGDRAVEPDVEVERGTTRPRPSTFHVPVTLPAMEAFQRIADRCAAPEICDHLHAHRDGQPLLTWFDAFDLPIHLARHLPEERVRSFASAVGTEIR